MFGEQTFAHLRTGFLVCVYVEHHVYLPSLPLSPFPISLTVSVDGEHDVHLLASILSRLCEAGLLYSQDTETARPQTR